MAFQIHVVFTIKRTIPDSVFTGIIDNPKMLRNVAFLTKSSAKGAKGDCLKEKKEVEL